MNIPNERMCLRDLLGCHKQFILYCFSIKLCFYVMTFTTVQRFDGTYNFKLLTSDMTFSCTISFQISVIALTMHHSSEPDAVHGQVLLPIAAITNRPPNREIMSITFHILPTLTFLFTWQL